MEIGISIGAFHTLAAALFLVVFLIVLLAGEQTLVEVGNTHILKRNIGQFEVNLFGTGDAHLTIET